VANAIREGRCPSDRAFDRFLLPDLQVVSHQYWTPTAVAVRAAQWFDELGVRRVLDVGSGAGKFCVAAALASEASFVGVEQRARLVDAARELARVFDVSDRVQFVHGLFDGSASLDADAYYFFNSFGENLFEVEHRLDDDVDLGPERFRDDVVAAERMLRGAPVGTHLLTYNGFGGMVPDSYAEVRVDRELPCVLRMWRKNQPGARAHDEKASSLRTRTAQCL
jgi:SAM-dependent methyltransferase